MPPPLTHADSGAHSLLEAAELQVGAPAEGLLDVWALGRQEVGLGGGWWEDWGCSGTESLQPPEVVTE